jgi:hypothetical protein
MQISLNKLFQRGLICALLLAIGAGISLQAERAGASTWRLLAVAYPDARDVDVSIGGSERALTARGVARVKWRDGEAVVEIEANQIPAPGEIGKGGTQMVLWAVDQDRKVANLGVVQLSGKKLRTKVKVPFRIFGLLLTAESDAAAKTPGSSVVLESRLPINPDLVLPVFRVEVPLGS